MLRVYLNYPNGRVCVHTDPSCSRVKVMGKGGQRCIRVDVGSFSREVGAFVEGGHRFASQLELNDMWVEVDFGDEGFEWAVVEYICGQLGERYKPFRGVRIERHC